MALRVRSKVHLLKVASPAEVSNHMSGFFQAQIRQATRAWLRAVLAKVPEYSGTARGTFKPLGRVLRVAVPQGWMPYNRKYERLRQYKLKKGTVTIQGKTFKVGPGPNDYADFYFDYSGPEYKFIFTQNLPYAFWNDIYPAPNWIKLPSIPPWHALAAGQAAFHNYLRVEMPKRIQYRKLLKVLLKSNVKRA